MFLEPQMGGLGTYVREILPAIAVARPDMRISVFVNDSGREYLRAAGMPDTVRLVTHKIVGRRGTRALGELTLMGRMAAHEKVDLLYSPGQTGPLVARMPHVVMVADVIWLTNDDPVMGLTSRIWRALVPRIARSADRVITISESSRRQIVELMDVPATRIDVTRLGFGIKDRSAATPESELRERLGLGGGPIVLCVSQIKLHKNLVRLVRAMTIVREGYSDAVLVIPGVPNTYQPQVEAEALRAGVEDAVVFPGWIDAGDLESLYEHATCFVLPSLEEGFGLPVLEAMARDLPVTCSNASALPEVAGEAARYFDPLDTTDIAAGILALLSDRKLAHRLVEAGRARYREFTWETCANQTLAAFARAGMAM
jgi:glycosyltransferase involved in cell wall biosynthesis